MQTADPIDVLLSQRFLPAVGGSIEWMYQVYRRWPRKVDVVTHDYDLAGHEPVCEPNLRMFRDDLLLDDWGLDRPGQWPRYWRMTRAVGQRLAAGQGRIVQVHCTHAVPEVVSLLPLKWRYGQRMRIVCYAHGEEITACRSSRQLSILLRQALGMCDLVLANSRYTRDLLADWVSPRRLHVVHPGVDLAAFDAADQAGGQWRQQRALGQRPMLLTLGRMDRRKNHLAVLHAVTRLRDRHPGLLAVMAGQGRELGQLKRAAVELGIADQVLFTGQVTSADRVALFGACDVFAMPAVQVGSDVEGFGMVFLEAAACGKPSIAGCEGGQADAVDHEQTGLVVDGQNVSQVTAAVDRLLSDAPWRARLGRQAREFARDFDWPLVVSRTVALVDQIASPARS